MRKKIKISERFFTKEELIRFEKKHGYKITKIGYVAYEEIDFSLKDEKDFLMDKGYPKILARFFR